MVTAEQLIRCSRDLVGVPWRHMGRTRHGVDCIGMLLLAGREAGVDFTQWAHDRKYSPDAAPDLMREIENICTKQALSSRVPGSLVCFKFKGERWPRHVAVLTEIDTIVHAEMRQRRQVIEHGYRAQWVTVWTDSIWLLPGIDYSGVSK